MANTLLIIVTTPLTIGVPTLLFKRKKRKKDSAIDTSSEQKPQPKLKGVFVDKVELAENSLKFLVKKGFWKQRLVVLNEIPILDIASIEQVGDALYVKWKDQSGAFFIKKRAGTLGDLCDKVKAAIEEQRLALEKKAKADLRRIELIRAINASLDVVDLSFDVLVSLHTKRVNWKLLESYLAGFEGLSITGQTIEPLILDLSNLVLAIRNRHVREVSDQSYGLLKVAHGYFVSLKANDDFVEVRPNFRDAKMLMSAYYLLNDLLLARIVDDREVGKESNQFKAVLQSLAKEMDSSANVDLFKAALSKAEAQKDLENVIEESRVTFREQFKALLSIES